MIGVTLLTVGQLRLLLELDVELVLECDEELLPETLLLCEDELVELEIDEELCEEDDDELKLLDDDDMGTSLSRKNACLEVVILCRVLRIPTLLRTVGKTQITESCQNNMRHKFHTELRFCMELNVSVRSELRTL